MGGGGEGNIAAQERSGEIKPNWLGEGREGLLRCWITRSCKSHMTGSHMLPSFVYTPHIAVQQQHVHTVKQMLTQSVWLHFGVCALQTLVNIKYSEQPALVM